MKDDPLVEEARKAGQQYIDSFKGDWAAVIADLQRRAKDEGRQIVFLPPRTPHARHLVGPKKNAV